MLSLPRYTLDCVKVVFFSTAKGEQKTFSGKEQNQKQINK